MYRKALHIAYRKFPCIRRISCIRRTPTLALWEAVAKNPCIRRTLDFNAWSPAIMALPVNISSSILFDLITCLNWSKTDTKLVNVRSEFSNKKKTLATLNYPYPMHVLQNNAFSNPWHYRPCCHDGIRWGSGPQSACHSNTRAQTPCIRRTLTFLTSFLV